MASMIFYYWLMSILFSASMAMNIGVSLATIYEYKNGPENNKFGTVVGTSDDWLMIGAPGDRGRKGTGSLFLCKPGKASSCKKVPYHREAVYWNITFADDEHESAIRESAPMRNQPTMRCYKPLQMTDDFNEVTEYGACFVTSFCKDRGSTQAKLRSRSPKTLCPRGASAALLKGSQRQLLMMNPGMWSNQGPFLDIEIDTDGSTSATLPGAKLKDKQARYKGCPSAITDYDEDGEDDYVIGDPLTANGKGSVHFFDKSFNRLKTISGEEYGARFGSAVLVTDLNGDGLDDLVVAATGSTNGTDPRSLVYIFYKTPTGYFPNKGDIIEEGHVLGALGDINKDGYNDLCVGSPAFGAFGKVTIYHGSEAGIVTTPSQVIYGSDFRPPIKQLGISISSGKDHDGNSFPDLLLGADGKAVYLRSRPILNVLLSIQCTPSVLDVDSKDCIDNEGNRTSCFEIHVCINQEGSRWKDLPFNLDFFLDGNMHEPRAIFQNTSKSYESVPTSVNCQSLTATLKEDQHWDYDTLRPMKVKVDLNLEYPPEAKNKAKLLPMIPATEASFEIRLHKGCGNDGVCIPDLYVSGSMSSQENGAETIETELTVVVGNMGENAFQVIVIISPEHGMQCWTIRNDEGIHCLIVHDSYRGQEVELCNLRKVIASGEEVTSTFVLTRNPDIDQVECEQQLTNITLEVKSSNVEEAASQEDNIYTVHDQQVTEIVTTQTTEIDPSISNSTLESPDGGFIGFSGDTDPDSVDELFHDTIKHTFMVTNDGSESLSERLVMGIYLPATDDLGVQAFEFKDPPRVTGDGDCDVSILNFCTQFNLDEKPTLGHSEAIVPQNCTLIECLIHQVEPGSKFIVTMYSSIDAQRFFDSRQNEKQTQAYYLMTRAFLRQESGWEPSDLSSVPLTLILELNRAETSSSVRITSGGFTSILLVIFVIMGKWTSED